MNLYAEHILDHYQNPRNYGPLEAATVSAEDANPLCGDTIRFDLRIAENGLIEEVGFVSEGCAISKAAASMLTEIVREKTMRETETLQNEDVFELLGVPLTPARVKCALLSLVVLKRAILLAKFPPLKTMQQ